MVNIPLKKYVGGVWEKLFPSMDDFNGLAGEGRTTETVKGNATAIAAHSAESAIDAHKISNINGLQSVLDGKATTNHNHDSSYAPLFAPINTKTDNYTLALTDAGKCIILSSTSDKTITVPKNTTVDFTVGTEIEVIKGGTGKVTIAGATDVTLRSKDDKRVIDGQYMGIALKKIDTNEWLLLGALM